MKIPHGVEHQAPDGAPLDRDIQGLVVRVSDRLGPGAGLARRVAVQQFLGRTGAVAQERSLANEVDGSAPPFQPLAGRGRKLGFHVYTDSEDRPIATMLTPKAVDGEFALMRVLSIGPYGAFVDWGLEKDLLVPHSEQRYPVKEERSYVVRVLLDKLSNRVIGSTKLHKFLSPDTFCDLKEGADR